jgi:molybdate transport system ATP-binding protein
VIEIAVKLKRGSRLFDAELRAEARILALVGPSGAGKSTLLNMVAGLVRPDEGRIAIDGDAFFDSGRGINLSPRDRHLGYVFQDVKLFPHMSALANLRYGVRFAAAGAKGVKFDDVVDLLGVSELLARRPGRLSGGERQRIAIGRALMSQPRALLLDEPLSAIDEARRMEILDLIERLRDAFAIPILFVSHRAEEIERLADGLADVGMDGRTRMRGAQSLVRSV